MTTTPEVWKVGRLCGCAASNEGGISYCRTHGAGPEMRALLIKIDQRYTLQEDDETDLRALLATIGGKE